MNGKESSLSSTTKPSALPSTYLASSTYLGKRRHVWRYRPISCRWEAKHLYSSILYVSALPRESLSGISSFCTYLHSFFLFTFTEKKSVCLWYPSCVERGVHLDPSPLFCLYRLYSRGKLSSPPFPSLPPPFTRTYTVSEWKPSHFY